MNIPPPNYTQTPNVIFDELLPEMGEAELKVTLVIVRNTLGWHREKAKLSVPKLIGLTGLSKQGVLSGVKKGINRGVIIKLPDGDSFTYSLNINDSPPDGQQSRPPGVNNLDGGGQQSRPPGVKILDPSLLYKEREKERTAKKDNNDDHSYTARVEPVPPPTASSSSAQHENQSSQTEPQRQPPNPPPTLQSFVEETAPPPKVPPPPPAPPVRDRRTDPSYAAACKAFEVNGFGLITPIIAKQLSEWLDTYPDEWIEAALTVAVRNGKRNLGYASGILRNWQNEGFDYDQHNRSDAKGSTRQNRPPADYLPKRLMAHQAGWVPDPELEALFGGH